jgi:hypothetical protein
MSIRSFRSLALTAALPLSLLCAGRAEALSTITQTVSNQTLNAFQNISFSRTSPQPSFSALFQNFDKFDSNLGTLHRIRFEGNGNLLGSFRGAKSSNNAPQSNLAGGTATLSLNFQSAGWITNNTEGPTTFIGGSPLDTTTQVNIGSQGTLLTSTDPRLTLSGSDTGTYFSAFEAPGGGTITGLFTWNLQVSSNNLSTTGTCPGARCTGFNFNPSNLTAGQVPLRGDIDEFKLFYDYKPFATQVPAPLPILGSGVAFAYTRRLRRRIQKARITL